MGLLRSEPMSSGTLVLPVEKARHFIEVLGYEVNLQFQDLHEQTYGSKCGGGVQGAFQRPYRRYIQRIDELERQVRFLFEKCKQQDLLNQCCFANDVDGFLQLTAPPPPNSINNHNSASLYNGSHPTETGPPSEHDGCRSEYSTNTMTNFSNNNGQIVGAAQVRNLTDMNSIGSGPGSDYGGPGPGNNISTLYKLEDVEDEIRKVYHHVTTLEENRKQLLALRNASIEEKYVLESASMALFTGQDILQSAAVGRGGGGGVLNGGVDTGGFEQSQSLVSSGQNINSNGVVMGSVVGNPSTSQSGNSAASSSSQTQGKHRNSKNINNQALLDHDFTNTDNSFNDAGAVGVGGLGSAYANNNSNNYQQQTQLHNAYVNEDYSNINNGYPRSHLVFNNIAGVISQVEQERFAKFVFRATRGNAYTHFRQINDSLTDPKTSLETRKSVFVIYFQGSIGSAMHDRISRACVQFGANRYAWVTSAQEAKERLRAITISGSEKDRALMASERLLRDELLHILQRKPIKPSLLSDHPMGNLGTIQTTSTYTYNSQIEEWRLFLLKERGIYSILNMCEGEGSTLRACVWYPSFEEDIVRRILIAESRTTHFSAMLITDRISSKAAIGGHGGGGHGGNSGPPTYFKSNDLVAPFQRLVNTYGVPRYQEISPVLPTIVTFPFLFGVMFGDIGHGILLLAVGLCICWYPHHIAAFINGGNENPSSEISKASGKVALGPFWEVRYMIVMMGFFSIYGGLMYNDFFALGVDLFGSRWKTVGPHDQKHITLQPNWDITNSKKPTESFPYDGPYPVGLDPVWKTATNELNYTNSLKMKLSVLFGVSQMIMGLFLRLGNIISLDPTSGGGPVNGGSSNKKVDFLCEWIPMMTFMIVFFGYMDYLIMYKWVTPLDNPPSIINTLICMTMQQPNDNHFYQTAAHVEWTLFTLMVLSVPILLIPKPLVLWWRNKRRRQLEKRPGGGRFLPLTRDEDVDQSNMMGLDRSRMRSREMTSVNTSGIGGPGFENEAHVNMNQNHGNQNPNMSANQAMSALGLFNSQDARDAPNPNDHHCKFDMTECVIHQTIETIEFVLGTVSHCASYLRLWALSLAHNQLSIVFFKMILKASLYTEPAHNPTDRAAQLSGPPSTIFRAIQIYFAFAIWMGVTVVIFLGIDTMECFMHCLRLHWVEFQSKFYHADGHEFSPYRHDKILKGGGNEGR